MVEHRGRYGRSQNDPVELSDDDHGVDGVNRICYLESRRLLCTTSVGEPFAPSSG